ncbi:MAG: 3',5'-cyclic-AMP phosphodiesterase [Gammaproteobacteria bacterium]
MTTPTNCLKLLQITDTHLFESPDGQLLGLNTEHSLRQVIDHILMHEMPDIIIATGDLTHDNTEAAYRRLRQHFSRLPAPVYCLPGNHDGSERFKSILDSAPLHTQHKIFTENQWQLLLLDSTIKDSEAGHLDKQELQFVEQTLSNQPMNPALIFVHHPPVTINSKWLDTMKIDNGEELLTICTQHPQVQAISCGHIHQAFSGNKDSLHLFAAPSTCVQFLPGSSNFAVDKIPPGYRRFCLFDDGHFETEVIRLNAIPGNIDMSLTGY